MRRRQIIRALSVTPLAGCVSGADRANAAQTGKVLKTPAETEGPFYPVTWNGDVDGNLVQLSTADKYKRGTPLKISGQILRADGSAASGARVAIWQCDAQGRYRHPGDAGEQPAADGFQGYGQVLTDAQGQYQFTTIKPVAYASRPPHVHFRIEDGKTSLTTQMYFDGENTEKGVLSRFTGWAKDRTLLTVIPKHTDAGGLAARFDIYL